MEKPLWVKLYRQLRWWCNNPRSIMYQHEYGAYGVKSEFTSPLEIKYLYDLYNAQDMEKPQLVRKNEAKNFSRDNCYFVEWIPYMIADFRKKMRQGREKEDEKRRKEQEKRKRRIERGKKRKDLRNLCNNPHNPNYPWLGGGWEECGLISVAEIKYLYDRDNAVTFKNPRLVRINRKGIYCFKNCKFIDEGNSLSELKSV